MPPGEPCSPIRLEELRKNRAIVRTFRDQLRQARATALRDAEAFDQIIHVVERLGSFLLGKIKDLNAYQPKLEELAKESGLYDAPNQSRGIRTPFPDLYDLVREARNDALHQGAFARHLTQHAIELSLVLEDALGEILAPVVSDYMVRNPVCAELWQPISFIRQQMLENSFSFLPVRGEEGEEKKQWYLVSDMDIAGYLRKDNSKDRKKRLAASLRDARQAEIRLQEAKDCKETTTLVKAMEKLKKSNGQLLLVCNGEKNLIGIVTAFDLL